MLKLVHAETLVDFFSLEILSPRNFFLGNIWKRGR
jgi:hypothetical protein